ncbi:hypothetical protein [Streptomyces fragilis]|uniref:Lipoprotein n=1 Tax=Streptomyces fragilis TaxID=67301 RepID=A0ABV2YI75_9ACTN|nr:hypothetical protein [Streptomyces fragilis]
MRKALTAAALLGLGALLLSGCSGSGADDAAKGTAVPKASQPAEKSSEAAAPEKGLDGTWRPINDSPIDTLKITGDTVTTTGELACPGSLEGVGTAKPRITLDCAKPDPDRTKGSLKTKSDGSAVVIEWDGQEWGGMIDSLRRG